MRTLFLALLWCAFVLALWLSCCAPIGREEVWMRHGVPCPDSIKCMDVNTLKPAVDTSKPVEW